MLTALEFARAQKESGAPRRTSRAFAGLPSFAWGSLSTHWMLASLSHLAIFEAPTQNSVMDMRKNAIFSPLTSSILAAAIAVAVVSVPLLCAGQAEDLKPIFNGTDLTGWQVPDPNPFWKVVDGVLIGESDAAMKGHVLYTQKSFKDFILETEARWNGEIDSGIMLRHPELQLQIGISRSLKKDMTCSFYTNGKEKYPEAGQAKDLEKYLKPGEWNKIRLEARGDTFTVWLNGQKVVTYTDPRFPDAYPIGLQIHPGLKMKIEFRNIRLKNLSEPN